MRYNPLGSTGLVVSQLGFGAAALRGPDAYHGEPVTDTQCERILHAALDAGINFIDTSDDYGLSEERIGRFVGSRRSEYALATKCGWDPDGPVHPPGPSRDLSRDNILRGVERSLRRLRTDRLDVLQLHNPTRDEMEGRDVYATLAEVRDSGLTRFVGVSATLPSLEVFVEAGVFDVFQLSYSLIELRHDEIMTRIGDAGGGVVVRGAVVKGDPAGQSRHIRRRRRKRSGWRARIPPRPDLWALAGMDALVADSGLPVVEFVLRFSIAHPHCHTAIVGMIEPEHLAQNVVAVEAGPLPPELLTEARRRMDRAHRKHDVPWRRQVRQLVMDNDPDAARRWGYLKP